MPSSLWFSFKSWHVRVILLIYLFSNIYIRFALLFRCVSKLLLFFQRFPCVRRSFSKSLLTPRQFWEQIASLSALGSCNCHLSRRICSFYSIFSHSISYQVVCFCSICTSKCFFLSSSVNIRSFLAACSFFIMISFLSCFFLQVSEDTLNRFYLYYCIGSVICRESFRMILARAGGIFV